MPCRSGARRERAVHGRLMEFGEAESLATPEWEAKGTDVETIEAELARLWGGPEVAPADGDGEARVTEKGLPPARPSVLNLIVTVVDAEAAERGGPTLMRLGVRHPSRAL